MTHNEHKYKNHSWKITKTVAKRFEVHVGPGAHSKKLILLTVLEKTKTKKKKNDSTQRYCLWSSYKTTLFFEFK